MPRLKIASRAAPLAKATSDEFGGLESRAAAQQAQKIGQAGQNVAQAFQTFSEAKILNDRVETTARTDAAVAEVSAFATQDADRASTDPDFRTSEDTHVQNVEDFVGQQRATIGDNRRFLESFDQRVIAIRSRSQMSVRHDSRRRQHEFSIATLDRTEDLWLQQAGESSGPDRDAVKVEHTLSIQRMIDSGGINAIEGEARVTAFEQNLASADVRRDIRDQPALAAKKLLGGGYPDITSPERRELLTTQALRAEDTRIRRLQAGRSQSDARTRSENKAISAKAYGEMMRVAADPEGDGLTVDMVLGRAEDLQADPENNNFEELFDIAQSGGRQRPTRSDPLLYRDLLIEAQSRGPRALIPAQHAFAQGRITQSDFDTIETAAEAEERFPDQFRFMNQSLDVGERQLGRSGLALAKRRSALAEKAFRDWIKRNPDASQEDAQRKVDEVSRSASLVVADDIAIFNLPPSPEFVVKEEVAAGKPGKVDIEATAELIMESGLPEDEIEEQLARLDKIDRAQDAEELRRNASQGQGDTQ